MSDGGRPMSADDRWHDDGSAAAPLRAEEARLLACVHCGFCLDACPTYTRLGDEADSPRGRLYLMRSVAEGRLDPAAAAFRTHIDRCLGCRACEPVCPSGVEYGFLLERAREASARASGQSVPAKTLLRVFANTSWSRLAGLPGRVLRSGGAARALASLLPRGLGSARFALAMLASSRPWRGLRSAGRGGGAAADAVAEAEAEAADAAHASAGAAASAGTAAAAAAPGRSAEAHTETVSAGPTASTASSASLTDAAHTGSAVPAPRPRARRRRVALLTGCVQHSLFARVNDATRLVLDAHGCDIVEVRGQRCCGALHAHGGELDEAHALARANIDAFEAANADHIVVNAAGCGAMMKEYAAQLERDVAWRERAAALSAKVRDIAEYLVDIGVRGGAPLALTVAYDAPCHLHHAQRITHAPIAMLEAIPGMRVVPIRAFDECCGGAGIYGILHPELGGRILADKVAAIREVGADVVATPNPGCMMQLGAGLTLAGDATPIVHPIELLAESWRRAAAEG